MSYSFPLRLSRYAARGLIPKFFSAPPVPPIEPINTEWLDGYELSPGDWPWMVTFTINGNIVGHGCLISDQHAITSGAVADQVGDALGIHTVLGHVGGVMSDLSDMTEALEPKSTETDPGYNPATFSADVGVVSWSSGFTLGLTVNPRGYASDTVGAYYGVNAEIASTGMFKWIAGGFSSFANLTVSVQSRLTDAVASSIFPSAWLPGMMAGQDGDDTVYTCYGAPWMANNGNGSDYLCGVAFYLPNAVDPGVVYYTEVGKYSGWIDSATGIPPNPGI